MAYHARQHPTAAPEQEQEQGGPQGFTPSFFTASLLLAAGLRHSFLLNVLGHLLLALVLVGCLHLLLVFPPRRPNLLLRELATILPLALTVTAAAATVIRTPLRTWWCAHPQSMQGPSGAPHAVSAILKLGNSMAG